MAKCEEEPFIKEDIGRLVLHPIRYPDIMRKYKLAQPSFWTIEEVDLSRDISDWENLSKEERHFLSYVLAFFATSDGLVNENLIENFIREVQICEARMFYGFQFMN